MPLKRVKKFEPCEACGKDTWCLRDETSVLCMRNSAGRPFVMKSGEIGYWHDIGDKPLKYQKRERREPEPPKIDADALIQDWYDKTNPQDVFNLAGKLGIGFLPLRDLRACWSFIDGAWAFPMRNGEGNICGIRLRYDNGKKLAVTGSKSGIFLPFIKAEKLAFIVEGPTDTAALLSLGVYTIGRPSCSGGGPELIATAKRLGIKRIVIIADNDADKVTTWGTKYNPGYDGARHLAESLKAARIPSCVMSLPCKDAREFVQLGGTKEVLESLVKNLIWENV